MKEVFCILAVASFSIVLSACNDAGSGSNVSDVPPMESDADGESETDVDSESETESVDESESDSVLEIDEDDAEDNVKIEDESGDDQEEDSDASPMSSDEDDENDLDTDVDDSDGVDENSDSAADDGQEEIDDRLASDTEEPVSTDDEPQTLEDTDSQEDSDDAQDLDDTAEDSGESITVKPASGDIIIELETTLQTMDGFGAADPWLGAISDAEADMFFDKDKGIGLSILRVGINSQGGNMSSWSNAQKAAARGAVVWAAPWSPPANCKSNNSTTDGGHLNASCYDSWANTLAGFAASMKRSADVDLYGVSAQNESDNVVTYDSCIYTAEEMVAFIKVLGPKLKALSPAVKLLAPEPTRWESLWEGENAYGLAILEDAEATDQVDILATHMYETQVAVPSPVDVPMPIWMTEMSGVMDYPEQGPSDDIRNGVVVAQWIYDGIAVGGASAWHYWWLISLNNDNEGLLLMGGGRTKRLYTMGNYSKFIRPGYQRVDVTGSVPTELQLTAYKSPSDGTVAIVVINSSDNDVVAPIFLSGSTPSQMTPWLTSEDYDLVSQTAIPVSESRFSAELPAQSVTTFVSGS